MHILFQIFLEYYCNKYFYLFVSEIHSRSAPEVQWSAGQVSLIYKNVRNILQGLFYQEEVSTKFHIKLSKWDGTESRKNIHMSHFTYLYPGNITSSVPKSTGTQLTNRKEPEQNIGQKLTGITQSGLNLFFYFRLCIIFQAVDFLFSLF